MNVSTEIKNKEDSLTALMSRILKEPLDPLSKSIHASMETLLDTKDKLDNIESIISVNVNHVEHMSKSLKRALNDIKDEVLPDHAQSIQRQFKTLSEAGFEKLQKSIIAQQQSIDILKAILNTTHDTVLGEISANQELNQRALADLSQHCTVSHQTLMASLQNGISLVENGIITQQRTLETTHQTLLEKFSSDANDRITIQQSIAHSIEGNQAALTRLLTEHNSVFITHIAAAQAKLKALTITAGVFFVSMLCYVGYDVWSKFN